MRRILAALAIVLGAQAPAGAHFVAFKSPGPGMHFTEGLPVIVFADVFDETAGFGYIVDGVGWPQLELWVDGARWTDDTTGQTFVPGSNVRNENGNPDPVDFYRFSASGLSAGVHSLVARGLFSSDGRSIERVDSDPITITVDPWPTDRTVVEITSDMTIDDLEWTNVAVHGNGHTITVTGDVVIRNSLITGLGSLEADSLEGTIDSLHIEDSIFEATGGLTLTIDGPGEGVVRHNEFRANNLITFDSSDPDASPVLTIRGSNTQPKVFAGNRIGAGRLVFDGVHDWTIGGDTDADTNVLIGPRCAIYLENGAHDVVVRGNYDHHNYRGGWSQGYNLSFSCRVCGSPGGENVLVEHNFIRDSSWPVEEVVGEFRYNVVYGFGHDWLRGGTDGASIHHNVFAPEGRGDLNEGLWFYTGEDGLLIYNNTFDGGGDTADFAQPTIRIDNESRALSVRNNLVTFARDDATQIAGTGSAAYVDYNAFYSPDDTGHDNYDLAVPGHTEGMPGFGGNDVSGAGDLGVMNGRLASSPFAGARIDPLESIVDEAALWEGTQHLSSILAAFRARYAPAAGSPIVDHGDPMDTDSRGRRADIGAIDLDGHDQDRFGTFGTPPSELVPPTVMLTAPTEGQELMGTAMLAATAMDDPGGTGVVLVQFLVDGATVGQSATAPYAVQFDTRLVANGAHAFAARAWDGAGNFAISDEVHATIAGNPIPREGMPGGCGCRAGGTSNAHGLAVLAIALMVSRRRARRSS